MLNFADYIFPGFRLIRVLKQGVNITNSSNPVVFISNVTLTVVECCSPPPVRLAAHCIAAASSIAASIASPNPITIGCAAHFIGELYDQC
jgi:hypothetical protein